MIFIFIGSPMNIIIMLYNDDDIIIIINHQIQVTYMPLKRKKISVFNSIKNSIIIMMKLNIHKEKFNANEMKILL